MAYHIPSRKSDVHFDYLPWTKTLKDGQELEINWYKEEQEPEVHDILRYIVNEEGDSMPQDDMTNVDDFRAFFLTHDLFTCVEKATREVLGAFYIKPNFPGRCSHISNGGFIVKKTAREKGIGSFMVEAYLKLAKGLGYKASLFNLVFVSNETAVRLWRKFGFKEIGRVPNAGNLKGRGYTDALQFYYDFGH